MQETLSSYSTLLENFSFTNITSSSSIQFESEESYNQMNEFHRKAYVKGLKRDITKNELDNCKRFKESNTYFNFEGLSKELDDIELSGESNYMESREMNATFSFSSQIKDDTNCKTIPLVYFSLNNSCLHDISFEFSLMSNITPCACSTKLNSTDLEILNISSCSISSQKQRRNTL